MLKVNKTRRENAGGRHFLCVPLEGFFAIAFYWLFRYNVPIKSMCLSIRVFAGKDAIPVLPGRVTRPLLGFPSWLSLWESCRAATERVSPCTIGHSLRPCGAPPSRREARRLRREIVVYRYIPSIETVGNVFLNISTKNMEERNMKIFAVGAHLDDLELACGGTLAKAIQEGHEVYVLIMSKSGYTNVDGVMQREDDVAVREGLEALHTLGIENIEILDFATKDIPFHSEVVNAIDLRIRKIKPDIIFTHHPFDTHQAHIGVSQATIAAARRMNTVFFYEPITPSGRSYVAFRPQLYVDISSVIDKKLESLTKHVTEYNKFGAENWVEGVRCRSGFRGYEIGTKYAEAFEILRVQMSFDKNQSF